MAQTSPSRTVRPASRLVLTFLLCVPFVVAHGKDVSTSIGPAPAEVTETSPELSSDKLMQLAATVTIYRDTYGVPHVFGQTDASTVFGFAYAQAEDNFWRVEQNFISALGRLSEVYGEETLDEDRLNHALEIPRLAERRVCPARSAHAVAVRCLRRWF